eukprot:GILJ01017937.1.p1 GENE.GILJ01017937.1~~GILJ01017937.1.p1  ORF type:complete len:537 (-),score=76.22 GILJ01017937.1:47-1657(-)
MTDGRFEAINSIRNNNWDQHRLWCERPQFQQLDPEIRYDESCPFHDLKADGCFQPEVGLMHDNDKRIEPDVLSRRKDGNRMHMGGPQGKHNGMGGYLMPVDTAAPRAVSAPKHAGKPWGTGGKIGLFSRPDYVACPAPPGQRSISTAGPRPTPYSNTIKLGAPVPYMPDDRTAGPKNNRWRLATGTYNGKPLPPVLAPLPAKAEEPSAVPLPILRDPFHNPHNGGAFGQHPTHMPTPYKDCPDRRRAGGALVTYAAKSKRNAPVQVPWSTLVQTADPAQDYPKDHGTYGYGGSGAVGSAFGTQTTVHHGSPGYDAPVYERQSANQQQSGTRLSTKQASPNQYTRYEGSDAERNTNGPTSRTLNGSKTGAQSASGNGAGYGGLSKVSQVGASAGGAGQAANGSGSSYGFGRASPTQGYDKPTFANNVGVSLQIGQEKPSGPVTSKRMVKQGTQGHSFERQGSKQDYVSDNQKQNSSPNFQGSYNNASRRNGQNTGSSSPLRTGLGAPTYEKPSSVKKDYGVGYERLGQGRQGYAVDA